VVCCVDRDAGLPADAALRHVVHHRSDLRLLLDAEGAQSADGAPLDAVQPQHLLSVVARSDARRRHWFRRWHQHLVRRRSLLVLMPLISVD